jgi:hypothetical protein
MHVKESLVRTCDAIHVMKRSIRVEIRCNMYTDSIHFFTLEDIICCDLILNTNSYAPTLS